MFRRHHGRMRVGVIDVGSNTVRVLVARGGRWIFSEREMLRLGADVERFGRIPDEKIARTAAVVRRFAAAAREAGAERLEIVITSPGRQAANGHELQEVSTLAGGCPARILSAAEEGRLAFVGAVRLALPPPRRAVAVVDVGGGSAQIVAGSRRDGPRWTHSIDIGSQRLTNRLLADEPPGHVAIETARAEVARYLRGAIPPPVRTALAVGGSARALKRIGGPRLGRRELDALLPLLAATPAGELARRYDIDPDRTRTLAAGAVILSALQTLLETPLTVARGGLRDGVLAELEARRAAA